jgi:hypothetical protein
MAKINEVHSVIVPAGSADLTNHVYTEVYGGSAGCSITVNGTPILMGSSSSIFINVKSVSGGSGCFLLGVKKDVSNGSPTLSGYPNPL